MKIASYIFIILFLATTFINAVWSADIFVKSFNLVCFIVTLTLVSIVIKQEYFQSKEELTKEDVQVIQD